MSNADPALQDPLRFAAILAALLARPPAKAGMRLRSQRILATQWGIDRNWLRRAFQELVRNGVLAQRHGSGTFVRRIPPAAPGLETLGLHTDELLDEFPLPKRRALSPRLGALRLAALVDLHWPAPTRRLLNDALLHQTSELGHQLDLIGVTSAPGAWLQGTALEAVVPADYDAFLVHDDAADAAMPLLEHRGRPYVVFDALDAVRHQPTVVSSLDEAAERAVGLLRAGGWDTMGLLSYAGSRNLDLEQFRHQRGLHRHAPNQIPHMATASLAPDSIHRATDALLAEGVDALYVADDNLFPEAVRTLAAAGRTPGRDIGLIAMSSHGAPLPDGPRWSRMVFDPAQFAQRTLQLLLASLQRADSPCGNLALLLTWEPGDTHVNATLHPPTRSTGS